MAGESIKVAAFRLIQFTSGDLEYRSIILLFADFVLWANIVTFASRTSRLTHGQSCEDRKNPERIASRLMRLSGEVV